MNDKSYRINELITKHLNGDITQEELNLLNELIKKCSEPFPIDLYKIEQEYDLIDVEKAIVKFENIIDNKPKTYINTWIKYAAVILLPIISFTIFWMVEIKNKTEQPIILLSDKKTTLTMDDGKTLLLDSNTINIQTEGVILTNKDGLLTYEDTSEQYKPVRYNTIEVPIGVEYQLELSDGTTVFIGAKSSLKYPMNFSEKERKVFLEGEAYFNVKPDAKTFIVQTSIGEIQVLGTSFVVTSYSNEEQISTTLVEGSILYAGKDTLFVEPGERLVAHKNGEIIKQKVNVNEYVGWTKGKFIFNNRPLQEIMNTMERWYDIEVCFLNPRLKELRFNVNIDRYQHVKEFLELLKETEEINYSLLGNRIEFY